jgi:hypothetical protein
MNRNTWIRHAGVAALAVLAVANGQAQDAGRPDKPAVLLPTAWPRQITAKAPAPGESPVTVDAAMLSALSPGAKVALGVAGEPLPGTVQKIERRDSAAQSVFGQLDGDPDSFFILTTEGQATVGLVQSARTGRTYSLRYVGDGVHAWTPVDSTMFPTRDCATGVRPDPVLPPDSEADPAGPADGGHGESGIAGGCNAPPLHFDVAIYYTAAARNEAGGTDAIRAQCQLAVDTTNQVYQASGISARMVLVFRGETSYDETSDVETDRDRLADPSDGYLDGAHATRNDYGADFVCLFVDASDPDNCGIAFCTPSDSSYGFCVVQQGCAVSNFSFPHEIGHIQGCAHNPEDAGSCNEYCDSYGHRFTGDSGQRWRTVMSYNDDNNPSTRIGIFSNPFVNFDGVPTGIRTPDCDDDRVNAGTINTNAASRENYRRPKFEVWCEFGAFHPIERGTFQNPWNTLAEGVAAIYGGGAPLVQPTLWLKAGSTAETVVIDKRMTVRACGGSAVIGQ